MVTTLNPRQFAFAENVLSGMSLASAYRLAGYSGEGQSAYSGAHRLMQKPAIAAFIRERQQTATLSAIADRSEIIARLTRVLRADSAALENDPPVQQVFRKIVVKADGTSSTHTRTKTLSRHTAINHLARMLGAPAPSKAIDRHELRDQLDRDQARAEVDAACNALVSADPQSVASAPWNPDPVRVGRNLNPRQRLFCEYLARDIPAVRAYRYAGYQESSHFQTDSTAASRLLRRPAIANYLRELRRHDPAADSNRDLASREEIQTYLTSAVRATGEALRTQERFIDQIVRDEIETSEGDTETRTTVKSVSTPRAMAQLIAFLDPAAAAMSLEDRLLLEMFHHLPPQPTLPTPEDRAAM
jgi:phage terminase small subunit